MSPIPPLQPHGGRYLVFDLEPSYSVFDHFEAVKGHVVGNVTRFAGRAIGKFRPNSDLKTKFQTETLPKSRLLSDKPRSSASPNALPSMAGLPAIGRAAAEARGRPSAAAVYKRFGAPPAQWCARERELYPCRRRVS
jgi:hypothetical protein